MHEVEPWVTFDENLLLPMFHKGSQDNLAWEYSSLSEVTCALCPCTPSFISKTFVIKSKIDEFFKAEQVSKLISHGRSPLFFLNVSNNDKKLTHITYGNQYPHCSQSLTTLLQNKTFAKDKL